MTKEELEIKEMVNRETNSWNRRDVNELISIFHIDMVWPWPETPTSHDPMKWVMGLGRYNKERWSKGWQELFDTHSLVHNKRKIQKIVISEERDGAFAVVDIDTLWINKKDQQNHWKGRTCKVYTRMGDEWKMIMQTGVLEY
jgi:ketosteroid isomerase-like protein